MTNQTWAEAFEEIATPHSPSGHDLRIQCAFGAVREALEEAAHLREMELYLFDDL